MRHQILNHVVNGSASDSQSEKCFIRSGRVGAFARFLVGEKLGVHNQAVLEIVYSDRSRFAETDRAQVAGHLDAAGMSGFHGRGQFRRRYVHVGLE